MDILRDPLWNNIRLDTLSLALLDTPAMQRLRYIRQLGHAYLVYPGATHTRFEHAVGAYHLAGVTLGLLGERGYLDRIDAGEKSIVRTAALLHDIGHYPFSHALEELGVTHHEELARPLLTTGSIADVLQRSLGGRAPEEVYALVTGRSTGALQGLISGSLDLDKIEYLKRDAFMCGVPYGEIDVDRLINSLVVVPDPVTSVATVGVHEKGLSALESLLFAKYQMFRNVYWHHAVRSATCIYKRMVSIALDSGAIRQEDIATLTDDELLVRLAGPAFSDTVHELLDALRKRRLHKRAYETPAALLADESGEWIASDYRLTRAVENRLARELKLDAGAVLLDYPAKTEMLGLDLPVLRRDGRVERLTASGWEGAINLPRLSQELYRSARRLRVFTRNREAVPESLVNRLLNMTVDDARSWSES